MSQTKLFVGNLSYDTTENDLHDAFAAHGTVVEANLMVDRMSGRPRGFAFVIMGTPEEMHCSPPSGDSFKRIAAPRISPVGSAARNCAHCKPRATPWGA